MSKKNNQSWEWDEGGSRLILKQSERLSFFMMSAFFILLTTYHLILMEWVIDTLFVLIMTTFFFVAAFMGFILKTTTFQKQIKIIDLKQIVDKKVLFANKIAIKLKKNKYRVLKFDRGTEKIKFIDQLTARRIPLLKRKYSWLLLITY